MSRPEVDGLNTGYAALLLEQYLDNPSSVPSEWRALFESAPEDLLSERVAQIVLRGAAVPESELPDILETNPRLLLERLQVQP